VLLCGFRSSKSESWDRLLELTPWSYMNSGLSEPGEVAIF